MKIGPHHSPPKKLFHSNSLMIRLAVRNWASLPSLPVSLTFSPFTLIFFSDHSEILRVFQNIHQCDKLLHVSSLRSCSFIDLEHPFFPFLLRKFVFYISAPILIHLDLPVQFLCPIKYSDMIELYC